MVAEECPVALVYDGTTSAVLMATPADLADLAFGFSLTEGIVHDISDITELSVIPGASGVELRMWLRQDRAALLKARRRRLVGPTGCGLCGIESLEAANRVPAPVVREISLAPSQVTEAVEALTAEQELNQQTRATHAAGFFSPDTGNIIVREDVGRHNALDKLAGALAAADISGQSGAVVLTSRISVEMVQKTAAMGAGIIVAISAPTALAIRTAERSGITLVGIARGREFEIFSHPAGITL
ncbi:MAG TPA: formate dehydrogenase accessory sulfurtransferase FdhD [Bradyrhizobium sp.]|nr:formate dehydrogenase accessory sulfurtransferase FdhD [Bradyrhizobium sp.]